MFGADELRRALHLLGLTLENRGLAAEIVVIGGGALLLHGWIARSTKDLDALAVVQHGEYRSAHAMSPALREAIDDTASVVGMDPMWLNAGPTAQLGYDLPAGFRERTTRLQFSGLIVHVAGRFDLICLKLYAAVDHDPRSKHVADLLDLAPDDGELADAATWVKRQDGGAEFQAFVDQVVDHLKARRDAR
mgnify:CR=1 FL=1